jgi:hypothetical protein
LQIIPWPVIESREFYRLFTSLKRRLDQQPTSHHTAGEFLHTLKTLMAKLKVCSLPFICRADCGFAPKANDWGAMSRGYTIQTKCCFLLNSSCTRNNGDASREFPPCNPAQCPGDWVFRSQPRARAAEGKREMEVAGRQTEEDFDFRTLIMTL